MPERPMLESPRGTEAASLLLEYSFKTLGINRVYAFHFVNNEASGHVMRRIGMRYEGLLRGHVKKGDEFLDLQAYGILREDYLDRDGGKKSAKISSARKSGSKSASKKK